MSSKIDYEQITRLIDLFDERKLDEFLLEVEGFRMKISRTPKGPAAAVPPPAAAPQPAANNPSHATETHSAVEDTSGLHIIRSPMVGTLYRAPDPSSPPFVEIGEAILPGQTVCIIEAMKLMNEIEADIEGIVEEIYIENGNPVEYGQKLFGIKPA